MTPTLDPNELDKRINDLKAVEGWLRMNLNMLSASINTLEVQRATLAAMQSFGQPAAAAAQGPNANPFVNPSMWPWNFMQQAAAEPEEPQPTTAGPEGTGR
jgi:tRNA U34 5-methylaminomethyl-2-thiouridine-forming methyltransferase MnmC